MNSHPATVPVESLLAECEFRRQRRSGPGGQHRNKVETAVFVRHLPTGIEAGASERRSQEQNRSVAITRLRLRLAVEHRAPRKSGSPPSPLWQQRLEGDRLRVSVEHDDFAAMLAEALDVLAEHQYAVAPSAEWLGCTTSQLLKLVRAHPPAWEQLARARRTLELPPLK